MKLARRLFAGLTAALMLFCTQADVYASAHCEHHSLPAPSAQHEHGAHHGAPAEPDGHTGVCTCLGICATSSPAAAPDADAVIQLSEARAIRPLMPAASVLLPKFTPYIIPFSTAPPSVS
ncbi:MAG: hypothetical protein ACT443_11930 [Gemmatimonadota bacterium]